MESLIRRGCRQSSIVCLSGGSRPRISAPIIPWHSPDSSQYSWILAILVFLGGLYKTFLPIGPLKPPSLAPSQNMDQEISRAQQIVQVNITIASTLPKPHQKGLSVSLAHSYNRGQMGLIGKRQRSPYYLCLQHCTTDVVMHSTNQ